MVESVGVDIMEVDRIRDSVHRWGERFLNRVFTSREIDYCLRRKGKYASLAARFAAKEAVSKALGSPTGINWTDVEIINNPCGKLGVRLQGKAAQAAAGRKVLLSLSHTKTYAVAVAVLVDAQKR